MLHINVQVALLNGHAYELQLLLPSSSVRDLRMAAQRAFGQKHLRLITGEKRVLMNFEQTLEEAQIKDGECLTGLVLQPQLAATSMAFALWCHGDSTIVTWGGAEFGGDSSAVQDQLGRVQQIQRTGRAFAAILADGSVVTWGAAEKGRWQFCSSTSAQGCAADSGDSRGICCDSGRWISGHLGQWRIWWWQFCGSTSAQGCAADSEDRRGICCDSGRWISGHLGQWRIWWWQFCGSTSAQGCAADSEDRKGICCDSGRWISGHLGQSWVWWWQFCSSTSAQACATDSEDRRGICCDSGRWFSGHLGLWEVGRWQVSGSTSAQGCATDSEDSRGICCDSGRWISGHLGQWRIWWWQFCGSTSAQGCAADSEDRKGICCDSGRWISGHLGQWRIWWWQFCSSRSARGCAADSGDSSGICCDSGRWIQWSLGAMKNMVVTVLRFNISSGACNRFNPQGGPLLPPPAPRRARRPPGPVLTKVQGAKGRKTYRAFSGLLHQDVLGALGLCADNSTGCELEKHVRRLVGSLPWGFALSILQTKWSCVSKIDSSTSLQGSCLAHCCSVSLLSWSPKLASSRLAFRLSNTGFAKSIHICNAVLCGLAP